MSSFLILNFEQVTKVAQLEEIVGQLTEERQELEQSHAEALEAQVKRAFVNFIPEIPRGISDYLHIIVFLKSPSQEYFYFYLSLFVSVTYAG